MPVIDPDDYKPGEFRNLANDLVEVIADALDTEGLNAPQRAVLVRLHNQAMDTLNFREPIPDTVPASWRREVSEPARDAAIATERAERRAREQAAAYRWRTMTSEERDAVVLAALGDDEMTTSELHFRLIKSEDEHGVIFQMEKLRVQLNSMKGRGVIEASTVTRKKTGSRLLPAWSVPVRVTTR